MDLIGLSRYISLILRHHPEAAGITLDEHGWAVVEELLAGIRRTAYIDMAMLEEIVMTDDKQRYSFNEDKTLIRANQGHSVSVDVELSKAAPPRFLYHGTGEKYTASINENGLFAKERLYVHLSGDVETAVKVGTRHGKPVVLVVDTRTMVQDNQLFYRSKNQIWLCRAVPWQYVTRLI